MKKELLCAHEYRTPVCKVVRVHVEGLVCASLFGSQGEAGADGTYEEEPEML